MRKDSFILLAAAFLMTACGRPEQAYDATGLFEATEVTVSAEQNGRLLYFDINEGERIGAGRQVGLIDTVQLYLQALQLGATCEAYAARRPDTDKQIAATRQQLAKARHERDRFAALVADGSANRKRLDDAESQVLVLEKQLDAQLSSLSTSTRSLNAQMSGTEIQRAQVADQLEKCHITSPITGIVLEKYSEQGEFAAIGKPLFKVADLDNMYLRAYLTSTQLKSVKLGQSVKIYADYGDGERREYEGRISWISSKSEFTPKTILTDDERADLVYAVKVAFRNDGYVKIGMYGEVRLQ